MDRPARGRPVRGAAPRVPSGAPAGSRGTLASTAIADQIGSPLAPLTRPGPLAAVAALALGFAMVALQRLGFTPRWLALLPLLVALASVVVVDLMTKTIPNIVTLPSLAYALVLAAVSGGAAALMQAGLGLLVGGGLLLLLAVLTRGGIGGGDIKLVALLGSALGWKPALIAFALSQLGGGVVLLYLLMTGRAERRKTLPIGALIALIGAGLLAGSG